MWTEARQRTDDEPNEGELDDAGHERRENVAREHHRINHDSQHIILSRALHDKARPQAARDSAKDRREQEQPDLGRARGTHRLEEERDVVHERDGPRAREEVAQVRREQRAIRDDPPRGERLARPTELDRSKCTAEQRRGDERHDSDAVVPGNVPAAVEPEEERENGDDERRGACEVDPCELGAEVPRGRSR